MNKAIEITTPGTVKDPGTVNLSTTVHPGTIPEGGGGRPDLSEPKENKAAEKPESIQDVLADEFRKEKESSQKAGDDADGVEKDGDKAKADAPKEQKPAPKPEAAKAEPGNGEGRDGVGQEPERQQGAQGAPSSEDGDDRSAPPARIAEDAKQFWRSTPRAIKAEVHRMEAELTRIASESEEARTFHTELKPYADMAKQAGTTVKTALDRYVAFDKLVYSDIGKGFAAIAKDQGKTPVETIGSLLRAYGVTPQQYAQAVMQSPDKFAASEPRQTDPVVAQVAQQVQKLTQMIEGQQVEAQREQAMTAMQREVDAWAKDKPDFREKEVAIAEILKSGIIERIHGQGLSVVQRLAAAYRMAGGNAETIVRGDQNQASPNATIATPPVAGDPGKKSVRGAPADGMTPVQEEPYTDIKDLLRKELRRMA